MPRFNMPGDDAALAEDDPELPAAIARPPIVVIASVRATRAGPTFLTDRVIRVFLSHIALSTQNRVRTRRMFCRGHGDTSGTTRRSWRRIAVFLFQSCWVHHACEGRFR